MKFCVKHPNQHFHHQKLEIFLCKYVNDLKVCKKPASELLHWSLKVRKKCDISVCTQENKLKSSILGQSQQFWSIWAETMHAALNEALQLVLKIRSFEEKYSFYSQSTLDLTLFSSVHAHKLHSSPPPLTKNFGNQCRCAQLFASCTISAHLDQNCGLYRPSTFDLSLFSCVHTHKSSIFLSWGWMI